METIESDDPLRGATAALGKGPLAIRFAALGVIVLGVAGAFAYAGGWLTPSALTGERIIDRFERLSGPEPGFRRNHAKGVGFTGFFESNGQGEALSNASVFKRGRVPVFGRFALAGGLPFAADSAAAVRSMAVQFDLPGGEEWRTGMNDIPVFPVNTAYWKRRLVPTCALGAPERLFKLIVCEIGEAGLERSFGFDAEGNVHKLGGLSGDGLERLVVQLNRANPTVGWSKTRSSNSRRSRTLACAWCCSNESLNLAGRTRGPRSRKRCAVRTKPFSKPPPKRPAQRATRRSRRASLARSCVTSTKPKPATLICLAEALGALRDPSTEPALVSLLKHGPRAVQTAAAAALAELGSVAAVEPLLALAESMVLGGDTKRAALNAVGRIQSRLGEVETGGLSLAEADDATTGALSMADVPADDAISALPEHATEKPPRS